jgi:hypothetical protein
MAGTDRVLAARSSRYGIWGSGYRLPISCAPGVALSFCPVGSDKFYAFALPAPGW